MSPKVRSFILFVIVAAAVPVLEALVKLDAEAVLRDPKPIAIGLGVAAIRAAAAAVLSRAVESRYAPRG